MAATPAWSADSAPRLFIDQALSTGAQIRIDGAQAHYLLSVMRIGEGQHVRLFDDRTGEWTASARDVRKRDLVLRVEAHLREREPVPDLWLCAAPIKKGRIDWLVEKACELGASRVVPVLTRRTVVDRVNSDRLRAHLIEAAEQCGRTALPALAEPVRLPRLLADWPVGRAMFFADETGGAPALATMRSQPGAAAILIGPEGGFDPAEREAIRALPAAHGVSLGPRILRADTAAAAAMSLWMAAAGDW